MEPVMKDVQGINTSIGELQLLLTKLLTVLSGSAVSSSQGATAQQCVGAEQSMGMLAVAEHYDGRVARDCYYAGFEQVQ